MRTLMSPDCPQQEGGSRSRSNSNSSSSKNVRAGRGERKGEEGAC
jgi:hypothetical protein